MTFRPSYASILQAPSQARSLPLSGEAEQSVSIGAIEQYRRALVALALDRTGRWDVAEEIAQQAIVIAWEQRGTLRERSALGAWLQRIVLNLCVSWQRREIRTLPLPVRDLSGASQQTVMESVMRRETIRDARLALANVPVRSRMSLLMHLSGYSYREIGEFLDLPVSTFGGRIARARDQLRRDLADRLGLSLEEKGEPGR